MFLNDNNKQIYAEIFPTVTKHLVIKLVANKMCVLGTPRRHLFNWRFVQLNWKKSVTYKLKFNKEGKNYKVYTNIFHNNQI